jgi:hypothetical protein
MSDTPNMYCKVYMDSQADKSQLLDLIANIISGSIKMRTVSSRELQVDLVVNEDFDETKRMQGEDQFLFYRYYLDIEPTEDVPRERYVESVGNLLEGLWRLGCKAVAACDFEEKLPRSGGYKTSSAG